MSGITALTMLRYELYSALCDPGFGPTLTAQTRLAPRGSFVAITIALRLRSDMAGHSNLGSPSEAAVAAEACAPSGGAM
jgi:hypothetical protein